MTTRDEDLRVGELFCKSAIGIIPMPVTRHTEGIYNLLQNGVNVTLTLKKDDGEEFTYAIHYKHLV